MSHVLVIASRRLSLLESDRGVIVDAIVELGLRTVREVRSATSAGTGCTCCHQQIRELLETHIVVNDYAVV